MRLALVTETFPPEVNGVSMTLGRLCSGLSVLGWDVQVTRPVQEIEELEERVVAQPFEEIIVAGVPLPGYKGLRMGEPAGYTLFRSWSKARPDVVHIATEGPLGLAALAAARALRIPVSSTFHTNFDQYSDHYRVGFIQRLTSSYLRAVHNLCECTLAPTRQMADLLAEQGYRNTGVLSRGVDTLLFDPAKRDESLRREWGVPEGGRVSLYVGRVAKEKNVGLALRAFEAIRTLFPEDRMVVVGDGPERARLEGEGKYPMVHYAGMRSGADLARHYASGDLFLFPSVTETFGNVLTEAMASGLAVCAFDYAAGRQYIQPGSNGELAAFGDMESFVSKAVELRARPNPELAALREEARATSNGISWEMVVASFQESIRQVVAEYRHK